MKNNKLLMPAFLKPDFSDFDFNFEKHEFLEVNEKFKQELLLVYGKKNTIILLDGNLIYKNISSGIDVNTDKNNRYVQEYLKKATTDFLIFENKKNLNSCLLIDVKTKLKKQKINLILAVTKQLNHITILEAERDANLELFEKVIGVEEAKINSVFETTAKENAIINHTVFFDIKSKHSQIFTQNLTAFKDANLTFSILNFSCANMMNLTYGHLIGQGANICANACLFANQKNVVKNLVLLEHKAKNSSSQINNVGVVNDNAKVEIDGVGKIEQGFVKSNAKQKSKFIMLKESASVVANPQLIINEFDVEAGHAAAIGSLDKEQIYYLQSRGLTAEKAAELLLLALAESFLNLLPASEKNKAVELIREKIN